MKNIDLDNIYINKTWKYLIPCLKIYGDLFISKFNNVFKLAAGISDIAYGFDIKKFRPIYILLNEKYNEQAFFSFLDFIRLQNYYIADYSSFICNYRIGMVHMVIIKVPEEFNDAYDNFIKGSYSHMYDTKQLDYLYKVDRSSNNFVEEIDNQFYKIGYSVLSKNDAAIDTYINKINSKFGPPFLERKDVKRDWEYDTPIDNEEIFNI